MELMDWQMSVYADENNKNETQSGLGNVGMEMCEKLK
jgi:hypothetical protein